MQCVESWRHHSLIASRIIASDPSAKIATCNNPLSTSSFHVSLSFRFIGFPYLQANKFKTVRIVVNQAQSKGSLRPAVPSASRQRLILRRQLKLRVQLPFFRGRSRQVQLCEQVTKFCLELFVTHPLNDGFVSLFEHANFVAQWLSRAMVKLGRLNFDEPCTSLVTRWVVSPGYKK